VSQRPRGDGSRPAAPSPDLPASAQATPQVPLTAGEDLRRVAADTVRLLPVATGLSLAGLYVLGALIKLGRLHGAGVPATDALPLIPLQQLLATAIPSAVEAAFLLPLAVAALLVGTRGTDRAAVRTVALAEGVRHRLGRALALVTIAAVAVALLANALWTTWPVTVGALVALAVASRMRARPLAAALAAYGVFVMAAVIDSYVQPEPLAPVSLRLVDGRLERGGLVAATDSHWHIAAPDGAVRSMPASRVVASRVTEPPPPTRRSLGDQLWDLVA